MNVARRKIKRRETIGVDPDAHRDRLTTLVVGHALDTFDRRKLRLYGAHQPIGDGRHAARGRVETEIERCVRPIGAHHFDAGRFRLLGQLGADLLQARRDLREGGCAAVVEF